MSRTGEPPSVYPPPGQPSVPPGAYPSQAPPHPSYFPPEPMTGSAVAPYAMGSGRYPVGAPSIPPESSGPVPAPYGAPYGMAPPSPGAGLDDDAFRAQLKPSIFGLPSRVVVALAVGGVFLVLVLALVLAR